ncbi:MAG: hypothetical protein ACI9U2_003515 [Bradymonadia bacterium]
MLCVGDPVALRPAIRVARCFGAEVRVAPEPDADANIILVQWGADRQTVAGIEGVGRARGNATVVLLADPSPPEHMGALLAEPWFDHLIGLQSRWFMADLTALLARIFGRAPFGIQAHLPWGARVIEFGIAASDEKDRVFGHIERFMASIGMRGRLVEHAQALADEMLMNAIYDAPIDRKTGDPKYANQRRADRVALMPTERPMFSFGSHGQRLVMGVRDPFGALTAQTLKNYIRKGLRRGSDQIEHKEGGAGLGLFLLFDGLNSISVNIDPGRATEFIGVINIRGSLRESRQTPKAFSVVTLPKGTR